MSSFYISINTEPITFAMKEAFSIIEFGELSKIDFLKTPNLPDSSSSKIKSQSLQSSSLSLDRIVEKYARDNSESEDVQEAAEEILNSIVPLNLDKNSDLNVVLAKL